MVVKSPNFVDTVDKMKFFFFDLVFFFFRFSFLRIWSHIEEILNGKLHFLCSESASDDGQIMS